MAGISPVSVGKGEEGVLASCLFELFTHLSQVRPDSGLRAVATHPDGIAHLQSPGNPKIRDNSPAFNKCRQRDFHGTPLRLAAEIVKSQAPHARPDQTLRLGFVMTPDFFVNRTRVRNARFRRGEHRSTLIPLNSFRDGAIIIATIS